MVLHFNEVDVPMHRSQLYSMLSNSFDISNYEKAGKQRDFCKNIYMQLGGHKSKNQDLALRRAKRLHQKFIGQKNYAEQIPCTTVYQLVEALNSQFE
jgi:hypothetical protein